MNVNAAPQSLQVRILSTKLTRRPPTRFRDPYGQSSTSESLASSEGRWTAVYLISSIRCRTRNCEENTHHLTNSLQIGHFQNWTATPRFANSAPTGNIAPADKKLYALRDTTATVESIPLITASIMSKKLAGGADALVLDVKCGPTAFMKTLEDARILAQSMVDVGTAHGMQIRALITRMDAPLGWAIGNALEVMESVEILRGEHGDSELAQMSFRLAAEMLIMGGAAKSLPEAQALVEASLQDGSALEALRRFVALNGGDAKALDDFSRLPRAGRTIAIPADRAGYVSTLDGRALGLLAMDLGAGRKDQHDALDLGVGIRVHVKVGQRIEPGDVVFTTYTKAGHPVKAEAYLATLGLSEGQPGEEPWLLDTIGC